LANEPGRIVGVSVAARLDDVLKIRLEQNRTVTEIETTGSFQRHFVVLNRDARSN